MKQAALRKSIIASLLQQIVTTICGFIVPRLLLSAFGSETNGLVSSITHLLNFIVLVEGGVTSVIMANLYKPLHENDINTINAVVNTAKKFFRRVAFIFALYTTVFGIIYSNYVKTSFSKEYVFALVIVLSINMFVQYCFSLPYQLLLRASQKLYIVSLTATLITLFNTLFIYILVNRVKDIIIVKLISAAVFGIQPLAYYYFANKYYPLNRTIKPNNKLLAQRWSSFGQNLAYYIHSNTDVVLLTLFSTMSTISVYSVYMLIINALTSMITSVTRAIQPAMGTVLYDDNKEKETRAMNLYIVTVSLMSSFAYSVCNIMVVPFVRIYTLGVNDANYIRPFFAAIIIFAEAAYCYRDPYVSVIYAMGHFKQTNRIAYLEAIINIMISIPCLYLIGLSGIALGTACGMVFRLIASEYYVSKYLISGITKLFYNTSLSFLVIYLCSILIGKFVGKLVINSYVKWISVAIMVSMAVLFIDFICACLFYREQLVDLYRYVLRNSKHN